jgi:uracil-DNA glycosylase
MQVVEEKTKELEWSDVLTTEKQAAYFKELIARVKKERTLGKTIYPPAQDVFKAFSLTPFSRVKVVILGQDPYHGPKQAMGLSFSVNKGVPFPPSLRNIFKELKSDLGLEPPESGDLSPWAREGVLLLNSTLTVEEGLAGSHASFGWQQFTDRVIQALNHHPQGVVYVLWGAYAKKKIELIDKNKNGIIASAHPSPLSASRGFLGSKPFSQANEWLARHNRGKVNWELSPQ